SEEHTSELQSLRQIVCRLLLEKKNLMPKISPRRLAQRSYEAFAAGDRKFFEQHLAENFTFSSPLDVGLDRAGYFDRCWPGSGHGQKFKFLRLMEHDDEVVVTYEMTKPNGDKA